MRIRNSIVDYELTPYQPETAAEFYADILAIFSEQSEDSTRYVLLNRLFLHLLDEHTAQLPIHLVGPFAKTDYLLKEHHAPKRLWRMVNDLRVRLNRFKNMAFLSPIPLLPSSLLKDNGDPGKCYWQNT